MKKIIDRHKPVILNSRGKHNQKLGYFFLSFHQYAPVNHDEKVMFTLLLSKLLLPFKNGNILNIGIWEYCVAEYLVQGHVSEKSFSLVFHEHWSFFIETYSLNGAESKKSCLQFFQSHLG